MSRIAALLVGLLFAAPRPAESADPPASEDKEKQKASLRRQIDDWMGARKWDEASAVIRRLQALSTAEEKRELERISIA